MDINIKKVKDAVILEIKGNFDVNASDFIEIVGELLREDFKKIACNFESVNMIDYMGLSALAIAYKNVCNHKARIKFFNVPAHIKNVFSMLLLDDVFEIYFSEEAAIASFEKEETLSSIAEKQLRRRFKRLPIKLGVRFKQKFSRSDETFEGKAFNLSAIGTFIFTNKIFNLNETLKLWLPLGAKHEEIELDARVVWLADKHIQPQSSPGMGVEFYNISTQLQKKIVEYVDRNLPRQSSVDV